jgi:peptidoglycan/LPS O-acetylase OafA/YrhL
MGVEIVGEDLPGGKRLPALDGLRGVAILLILLFHGAAGFPPLTVLDRVVHAVGGSLWFGVDLFFVLSGFLITGILCDTRDSPRYFRNFYLRRALRIFPLYYTVLTLLVILAIFSPLRHDPEAKVFLAAQGWYWSYLLNLFISRYGWVHVVWGTGHLWSLAVEEQFYLIWPAVVRWVDRSKLVGIAAGAVVAAPILRAVCLGYVPHVEALYMLTPMRFDSLGIGALIALRTRRPGGLDVVVRWMKPAASAGALALITIAIVRRGDEYILAAFSPPMQTVGYTAIAVLGGACLVAALRSPIVSGLLSHPLLRMMGKYSYAMYVVHYPLIWAIEAILRPHSLPPLFGSNVAYVLLRAALVVVLSLSVARVSFRFLEGPILELKELLAPRN